MPNTDNLTVLILAAGYGRRMGPFSRMINKGLVPYGGKPLISHIMGKFPITTKFVVACGNMSQQLKDYVLTVHEDKDVTFVDIPDFNEGTTGPATTIRQCKEHLDDNFLWITCDTLFSFDFSNLLNDNWIAVHPVDSTVSADYCWVERNGNNVVSVRNKEHSDHAVSAFIGLMYVKDKTFIDNLEASNATEVYQGFLDNLDLKAYDVIEWKDFGTYERWKQLNDAMPEVSFPKPDELFYCDNNKIVKFTTDPKLAPLKFDRYLINPNCFPTGVDYTDNFLLYDYVPGETLYQCLTPEIFIQFLNWCELDLWKRPDVTPDTCNISKAFYQTKTFDRLNKFRTKYSSWVEPAVVNKFNVKPIDEYINKIDFEWLCNETLWCFIHGDMQFDNIIFDKSTQKFTAIDWRTDFAGSLYGDMYYDLAKMLGGLYLSYKAVKENKLTYLETSQSVQINLPAVDDVNTYSALLREWVEKRGLDWDKVVTLVPLIYLNMAPLHDPPFDKYLVSLSQLLFSTL